MGGGCGGGVMNWEIGIDICTVICIKWMTNKNLLYKKKKNLVCIMLSIMGYNC